MRLLLSSFFILFATNVWAVVEDPSTFTLGGTALGDLSATSTRLTAASGLLDNENAYAIKDYGANYFGAFDVQGTIRPATTGSSSLLGFLCFSDTANVDMGGMNTANDGICIRFKRAGTDGYTIRDFDNGTSVSTDIAGANDTTRYFKFDRSGTTCTLHIYTDSGFTTDDTGSPQAITCSDASTVKYRYMYLAASGGTDGFASSASPFYVENVTINQADTGGGGGSTWFAVVADE